MINKIKIINSKFVSLKTGEEIYGDFKFVENLDQLNKIVDFIIDSFCKGRLPISGEYTSVIKELEFVKRAL
ncbi:MAG: hypothetical protein IJO33_04830 [Bacilli bacterium]|nr:hypothetical protein [Bacilli bacterium]